MASLRCLIMTSLVAVLLGSAFALPFIPDPEDDYNVNEINSGKFEENDGNVDSYLDEDLIDYGYEYYEEIPDDEEMLEVSEPDEVVIRENGEDLDAEESVEVAAAEEAGVDDEAEEEEDARGSADGKDDSEPVVVDESDAEEDSLDDIDQEEVESPSFVSYMYKRAREFLQGK